MSPDARARRLRALFVANDGFSAGHVVRAIAVATALARRAPIRGVDIALVIATTSEADALLHDVPASVVRLPSPAGGRRGGLDDRERRRLVRGALEGVADAFGPDLVVLDTFPAGPHGEAAGIGVGRARRVLLRRSVPGKRAREAALADGLDAIDLAIVASDPDPVGDHGLGVPVVSVPPITLREAEGALDRAAARAILGLPGEGRTVLVAAGGGGDPEAARHAVSVAHAIVRATAEEVTVVAAGGPLARGAQPPPTGERSSIPVPDPAMRASGRLRVVEVAPLQPYLAAFDAAFSPAGYNTAHELGKAGIPMALWAEPRPFDDQAARVDRFAAAGLATPLRSFDDAAIAAVLSRLGDAASDRRTPPVRRIERHGADRAADALLDLMTARSQARRPPG